MVSEMFPKEKAGIWDPGSGAWGLGDGLGMGLEWNILRLTYT